MMVQSRMVAVEVVKSGQSLDIFEVRVSQRGSADVLWDVRGRKESRMTLRF